MNKRVLTGMLAVLLFITGFAKAGAASYHERDVEEYVMQQLAATNIPGGSLSIVTSQKEIYSVAFGDVQETSSGLQISALTRTFTTLAIMQLVEKGDINLEDRVLKYIKNPSQDIAYNTTIKELLSYTKPEAHEFALADTLEAYNLDAELDITVPLDMQSTYTIGEADSTSDITPGCRNYFGLPLKDTVEYKEEGYWLGVPSNGLVSNVKDMGKYIQMYLSAGGKVVSYNTMESIMGKGEYAGQSIFGTDAYYTMGWIATEIDGQQVYYCNGSVENYTSAMFIIPSMDIGIVILFNSADALTGQKYTDEIEAGAVSLVMGGTARAVSSNSYLMEHGAADVIYFLAFVCSILPLLMMEVWVRWTKDKFSIIRMLADILLHIVIPTSLIFAISKYIAPWKIIKKAMPDLFFVSIVVIGLFYIGLAVKIIAHIIIFLRGGREEHKEEETEQYNGNYNNHYTYNNGSVNEEDVPGHKQKEEKNREKKNKKGNKSTEEDKEAREKKDKLVKRMRIIKEAGKNETENRKAENIENTEIEEDIKEIVPQAEEASKVETNNEETSAEKIPEEEIMSARQELVENNPESAALQKEDVRKKNLPGRETKTVGKTEKAKVGNNKSNRPKRFVVTNEHVATKRDKSNIIPEDKRDKSVNRGNSKSSPANRRKSNSANSSRGTSDDTSLNRKGNNINKRKNNYNSISNKNSTAKDSRRNIKK